MLENVLLLIQIIVMGWVIFRTVQHELRMKKQPKNQIEGDI